MDRSDCAEEFTVNEYRSRVDHLSHDVSQYFSTCREIVTGKYWRRSLGAETSLPQQPVDVVQTKDLREFWSEIDSDVVIVDSKNANYAKPMLELIRFFSKVNTLGEF